MSIPRNESRRRRVSYEQLESLWEFLNSHRDIAVGYNKSTQARDYAKRMWVSVSDTLNSLDEGANKDWKGWSNYWVDYKAKLKRKVAALRTAQHRTGGGPSEATPLNDIEKKFLSVLGDGFGSGLPNTQVDPFPNLSEPVEQVPATSESHELPEYLINELQWEEIEQQEAMPASQAEEMPAQEQVEEMPAPQQVGEPNISASASPRGQQRRRGRRQAMTQLQARQILVRTAEAGLSQGRENTDMLRGILNTLNIIATELAMIRTTLAGSTRSTPRGPETRDEGSSHS